MVWNTFQQIQIFSAVFQNISRTLTVCLIDIVFVLSQLEKNDIHTNCPSPDLLSFRKELQQILQSLLVWPHVGRMQTQKQPKDEPKKVMWKQVTHCV